MANLLQLAPGLALRCPHHFATFIHRLAQAADLVKDQVQQFRFFCNAQIFQCQGFEALTFVVPDKYFLPQFLSRRQAGVLPGFYFLINTNSWDCKVIQASKNFLKSMTYDL